MKADRRLVEHIESAREAAAELRAEAQTLHLATGEGACGTVEREVTKPDFEDERKAPLELRMRGLRDRCATALKLPRKCGDHSGPDVAREELRVRLAEETYATRQAREARPAAIRAELSGLAGRRHLRLGSSEDTSPFAGLAASLLRVER